MGHTAFQALSKSESAVLLYRQGGLCWGEAGQLSPETELKETVTLQAVKAATKTHKAAPGCGHQVLLSEPLYLLFPLPGILFPQIFA